MRPRARIDRVRKLLGRSSLEPLAPEPPPVRDLGTLGSDRIVVPETGLYEVRYGDGPRTVVKIDEDEVGRWEERDEEPPRAGLADHDFMAPEGKPWGLCEACGFGQAAHPRVPVPYVSTAPRAARPQLEADVGESREEES